jgi:hypothetical protein
MSTPAAGLTGQLTSQELEQGRRSLDRSRDAMLSAIDGLSEAQWHFKPSPECWSAAEILEHVVAALERVLGTAFVALVTAPPPPVGQDCQVVDALILKKITDRSDKFPAPAPVIPSGSWPLAAARERLLANDAKLRQSLESTPDLRQHAIPFVPLKAILKGAYEMADGYQFILFASGHTERHALQILEVKANANFPKS